jgi:hypothetical protein
MFDYCALDLSLSDDEPEVEDDAPGLDIELLLEPGVPVEVEPLDPDEPLEPDAPLVPLPVEPVPEPPELEPLPDVPLPDEPLLEPLPVMLLPEPLPDAPAEPVLPELVLPPELLPPVALDEGEVDPLDDELGDAELALLGVEPEPAAPLLVS